MLIDPFRFARKGEQLERVLSLSPEGRMEGIITQKSEVVLTITGNKNEDNRYVLEGHIGGDAIVQCQVCLEDMKMPLDIDFRLFPVMSEEQAERLYKDCEPIVIEDNSLDLNELVINELILSMPVALSHIDADGSDCADKEKFTVGELPEESRNEKKSSPFAILQSIKQKDS